MKTILFCDTLEQLPAVAQEVINLAKLHSIWLFEGEMGAGKTTLIKAICHEMGILNTVQSPTYSIVNEYATKSNVKVFHFDLYRIKSEIELFELGFEEYISSNNYVFIEWPELALPYLDSYLRIIIKTENNNRYLCAQIIKSL